MSKSLKLNVALAKSKELATAWKNNIADYIKFFKSNQGSFQGIRKTYQPRPETIDLPNERQNTIVVTTVQEKMDWFYEQNLEYLNLLFAVEATNSSGTAKAKLEVDGHYFGELTSLQLLRLIDILESNNFKEMFASMPVRSDSEDWQPSTDDLYKDREIYSLPKLSGTKSSIEKKQIILEDKNLIHMKDTSKYVPQIGSIDEKKDLGDYTLQYFSGMTSHKERATLLSKIHKLVVAAKAALKEANEAELVESQLTAEKLFRYLDPNKAWVS